jgi:hypothetical protein
MRFAFAMTMLVAAGGAVRGAQTLDRIAVTVGRTAITESALVMDLRVAAFLDRKPVEITGAAKRAAAQRLVDQVLILEEARQSLLPLPGEDGAQELVEQIKMMYSGADEFDAELERHDITVKDLEAHMLAGLRASAFTDLRFRPAINVPEEELRAYYNGLVRKQPGAGAVPPFEESRADIEKLLAGERVLKALDSWLETARAGVRIQYREKVFE